jgi:Kef-type K+ transport system membrane component KefB
MDKRVYLGLAVIGFILPYTQFISFLMEYGFNFSLIVQEITYYRISMFAWFDIVLTAIVVIVMVLEEKRKLRNSWLPIIVTLIIGPSCGLPLYMYIRKRSLVTA